ncbi:hypothetical protein PMAYCL1PPCAC_14286, partial [Pristionchus mayeri]
QKEPKDEPSDVPLPNDDQMFDMDFNGDEIVLNNEPMLNEDMSNNLGDWIYMAGDVIDNREEKEETVDSTANTPPDSFDNEGFGGDQMKFTNETMLN